MQFLLLNSNLFIILIKVKPSINKWLILLAKTKRHKILQNVLNKPKFQFNSINKKAQTNEKKYFIKYLHKKI